MPAMLTIIPSRGRPDNIRRLASVWHSLSGSDYVVCIDNDDPAAPEYVGLDLGPFGHMWVGERRSLSAILNVVSGRYAPAYSVVGFMGDDHLPRTFDWDGEIFAKLDSVGIGIAYGDDLHQGQALPTAVFMSSPIIQTLGHMAPPTMGHLYLDNAWKMWGERTGTLHYMPNVVIEHVHPSAGKAEWDDGYRRVNSSETFDADREGFAQYQSRMLDWDVAKIRKLVASCAP